MSTALDYRRSLPLEKQLAKPASYQGLSIEPVLTEGSWNLRGRVGSGAFMEGVQSQLGLNLPTKVGRTAAAGKLTAICVGPDEWYIACEPRHLELSLDLDGLSYSLVDLSDQMGMIDVSGDKARDLMSKAVSLDLHPSQFKTGMAARTLAAKAQIIMRQTSDEPSYRLIVRRSFADYLWDWLTDASREYRAEV